MSGVCLRLRETFVFARAQDRSIRSVLPLDSCPTDAHFDRVFFKRVAAPFQRKMWLIIQLRPTWPYSIKPSSGLEKDARLLAHM